MEELLKFLVKNITGIDDVEIQKQEEDGYIAFTLKPPQDRAGMLIGKEGKIIKTITRLMKVRATLDKKRVSVDVLPKE